MKWAWAVVITLVVLAGGIFVFRVVTASNTPDTGVQTVTSTPAPTTTTSEALEFADPSPDQATEVVTVVAVDGSGNPATGYRVEDGGEVENCLQSPAGTDAGVVSCSPTAESADVCWVTPAPLVLLCGTNPWEKSLRRLTTTQPARGESGQKAQPWGLELADGAKCRRRNGGSWPGRADGLVGAYSCDREGEFVLAGDGPLPNRTRSAWTVVVGGLGANDENFPPPVEMRVVKAYFAASR
ncbi:hypothetical protein JNUCC0626_45340 [Lentzea sp. JNUCC 0626]|uniref:hypothetical protein n=1 Tax=Lentzea sp. JNUCC 0626 TaxID=3367513 RepID=UPI00374A93FC